MILSNNANTFTIELRRFLYVLKYLTKALKYSDITSHYKKTYIYKEKYQNMVVYINEDIYVVYI